MDFPQNWDEWDYTTRIEMRAYNDFRSQLHYLYIESMNVRDQWTWVRRWMSPRTYGDNIRSMMLSLDSLLDKIKISQWLKSDIVHQRWINLVYAAEAYKSFLSEDIK